MVLGLCVIGGEVVHTEASSCYSKVQLCSTGPRSPESTIDHTTDVSIVQCCKTTSDIMHRFILLSTSYE